MGWGQAEGRRFDPTDRTHPPGDTDCGTSVGWVKSEGVSKLVLSGLSLCSCFPSDNVSDQINSLE